MLTPALLQPLLAGVSRTLARGGAQDPEAAAVLLEAFHPQTPIQAMLAAQAIALHHAAMDCFGRAMEAEPEDHATAARMQRNAASLTRAFTATLRTIQRCQALPSREGEMEDHMQPEPPRQPPHQPKPEPESVRHNAHQDPVQRENPCTFHAPPPGRAAVVWGCGPARRERPKDPAPGAPCMDQRPAGTAATTVQ